MSIDLNGVVSEPAHEFKIQTPQGVIGFRIPHSQMKCCPCGCDVFDMKYKVTWVRDPSIVNSPVICCNVQVYVCSNCNRELLPTDGTVAEVRGESE